jgi:hypothetical protein
MDYCFVGLSLYLFEVPGPPVPALVPPFSQRPPLRPPFFRFFFSSLRFFLRSFLVAPFTTPHVPPFPDGREAQ